MLIEDVACPVDKLADMTVDLVEMFQKFGYKDASCFGHALEGNLHLVFSQVRNLSPIHIEATASHVPADEDTLLTPACHLRMALMRAGKCSWT